MIDLHTHFVDPSGLAKRVYEVLHHYSLRGCDALIVTNDGYERRVREITPRPIWILPDRVPVLAEGNAPPLEERRMVLYVCTFSSDEPWSEVIEAGKLLPPDTVIYITGRVPTPRPPSPPNVVFTGYVPRSEYEGMLRSADIIMVLTTASDNLMCGGYEAVAAGKPLILSDTPALRALFSKGTVFTESRREAIARAIDTVASELPRLRTDMEALRVEMSDDWERLWGEILDGMRSMLR